MSEKNNWFHDNKFLIFIALLAALLVYGVELGSFTLSIDEEVAAYEPASWKVWLSQGRWGMALLLKLLPNFTYIPYLATLLFCSLLALSSVYFAKLFFREPQEAAVFVILFVASPIWLHVAEFNTLSWGIGIGLVACAYSVELFHREKMASSLLAFLLIGFATAVYQALLILYAMLLLMLVIRDGYRNSGSSEATTSLRTGIMQLVRIGTSVALAVGFYLLVHKIAIYITHTPLTYIGTFVHVNDYLQSPVATFLAAAHKIFRLITGTDASYLGWGWAILILPWLGCVFSLRFAMSIYKKPALLTMFILAVSALLFLCFSLVILAAGSLPLRAVIGLPLLCAVSGVLGFRLLRRWPVIRIGMLAYSSLVCIWISAFLFGLDGLARQRDEAMAAKIAAEIMQVAPEHLNVVPVVFVGKWSHEPVQGVGTVEIFGTSFFEQDGGNRFRIAMFMRLMGTTNVETLPLSSVKPYLQEVDRMASWPARGSVLRINNMVVVKLGNLSQSQKAELGL